MRRVSAGVASLGKEADMEGAAGKWRDAVLELCRQMAPVGRPLAGQQSIDSASPTVYWRDGYSLLCMLRLSAPYRLQARRTRPRLHFG